MRRIGLLVVGLFSGGVCGSHDTSSPLGELAGVTRIEVSRRGEPAYAFQFPADSLRIAMVAEAVRAHRSGWENTWHTLPAGDLAVSFMRDSALLGVLWVGPEFLVARGTGRPLLTSISSVEEIQLRALLDTGTVLGTISKRSPKPPQN